MKIPISSIAIGVQGFAAGAAMAHAVGCETFGIAVVATYSGVVGVLLVELVGVVYAIGKVFRTIVVSTMPPSSFQPPKP